jgi:cellulose synthase (UDP-forming)
VQWPMLKPFAVLFGLTALGLILPLVTDFGSTHIGKAGDGIRIILFWSIYNLIVLAITMLACIERPRVDRPQRENTELALVSVGKERFHAWVLELGVSQARVRGPSGLTTGHLGMITFDDVGDVRVQISGKLDDGYKLDLRPTPEQRIQILRKLHTAPAVPGASRGDLVVMVRSWMRSLTSQ